MERRATWLVIVSLLIAGCNSSDSPAPTATPANTATANPSNAPTVAASADPAETAAASDVAHKFLDAVVRGDTATANSLLTPLAVERIAASGKPFQLPGLSNYTFRVGQIRLPAPDKAFVQCMGTDRTAGAQAVEEEFCWLMSKIDADWRIAGVSFTAGPKNTLMIFSFEDPEKGAMPVQQLMARSAGQTAAASSAATTPQQATAQQQPTYTQPSPQQAPAYTPPSQPYTAQPQATPSYR